MGNRWRVLGAALLAAFLCAFAVAVFNSSPQARNLRAVDRWLADPALQADVAAFQRERAVDFRLYAQTRHQGVVGLMIEGESAASRDAIVEFVLQRRPPRPVEIMLIGADGKVAYEMEEAAAP